MDVYVDTNELDDGAYSLTAIINRLEALIDFIKNKIELVGEEFTSVNYDRISGSVKKANDALDDMNKKLEAAKRYLNRLTSYIEQYNSLKF